MPNRSVVFGMGVDLAKLHTGLVQAETLVQGSTGRIGNVFAGLPGFERVGTSANTVTPAVNRLGTAMTTAGRSVRGLAVPLLGELAPALGASSGRIGAVLGSAALLGSGFGGLALAAVGVGGVLAGSLIRNLRGVESGAKATKVGIGGLADSIKELETALPPQIEKLSEMNRVLTRLRAQGAGSEFGKTVAEQAARAAGTRGSIEALRGAELLEDPAAGPAGPIALKLAADAARAFDDLTKNVRAFQLSTAEGMIDSALQKQLAAIRKEADLLIASIPATATGISAIVDSINKAAGVRMDQTISAAARTQGPGAAAGLGLGGENLFAGFQDVDALTKNVNDFRASFEQLARSGVPVTDLFRLSGDAAAALDTKMADLQQRFADQPAVIERLKTVLGDKAFGGFQRDLDAIARGMTGAREGTVTLIDTAEGITSTYLPALSNVGSKGSQVATVFEGMARNFTLSLNPMVVLTGQAELLAAALQRVYTAGALANTVVGRTGDLGRIPDLRGGPAPSAGNF